MIEVKRTQEKVEVRQGISLRAVLLGFVLLFVNAYWVTLIEVKWYGLDGSSLPLFVTPIFLLLCVVALNSVIARLFPRLRLNSGELTVIYVMTVISCVLASHDMLQNLFGSIAHVQHNEMLHPDNGWKDKFVGYIPQWLFLWDPQTVKSFYDGGNFYTLHNLTVWGPPLLAWAGFIIALLVIFVCVDLLLRKPWAEHERLVFPIIQLPLAMTDESGSFWRSKAMWAGFTVAALITGLNGLHLLVPEVPMIAPFIKQYHLTEGLSNRPWSAISNLTMTAYPFAIGLAFFMPLDLSFSCWFFYIARCLLLVLCTAIGLDSAGGEGWPYTWFSQHGMGAMLTFGILILWSVPRQVKYAWKAAFHGGQADKDGQNYRWAFIGIGISLIVIFAYFWRMGLTMYWAVAFFSVYFIIALALTRIRAEVGASHEIYFINPQRFLFELFGSSGLIQPRDMTIMQSMYWFNRAYRAHPMPNQLEALQLGASRGINPSKMAALLIIVGIVAIFVVFWMNLHITYAYGAAAKATGFKSWVGEESFGRLNTWLSSSTQPNPSRWFNMIGSGIIVVVLSVMRRSFVWWPFHPAGYTLAVSSAVDYFWFPFFISWLIKLMLTRYGGTRGYQLGASFALGLILGDYTIGSLWAIIGPLMGIPTYKLFI